MTSIYIKPAINGNIVRQPERANAHLPSHGAKVPKSAYWARRLKDGSVVETTEEAIATAKAVLEKARAKAEAAAKKTDDEKSSAKNKGAK